MQAATRNYDREAPEKLVGRLAAQLRNHALWDALLIFFPPVIAALYVTVYLYRAAWIGPAAFFLTTLAVAGVGLVAVVMRYRPLIPSMPSAARLVDNQAGAKDRFLTLTTVERSEGAAPFLFRLRAETAGFLDRIELRRDFPYRIKRSFYWSLLGSIAGAILFLFLLPIAHSTLYSVPAPERLREIARQMAQRPGLSNLASILQTLAAKLENPKVTPQEEQALIQETEKKISDEQQKQEQKDNRDLLGQAASTLKGMERQSGKGQDQQKDQAQGGGGVQSNLPQEGQGEGKQSQGSGGDSQGEINAQVNQDMQQGKLAQGEVKDSGKAQGAKNQGDGKGQQLDPNKSDSNKSQENGGKNQNNSDQKVGRTKEPEEVPQGTAPAERFYKPGEKGKDALKGAGYVTVQLPEDVAADSKGESTTTRDGGDRKTRPKVPVSNVPLPAHVPDAPMEKQEMPLEYRGIIR